MMELHPFFSADFSSNVYLLRDKKKLLIDSGLRPLNLPKVDILILTHCHLDHIGMAASLQKKTNCEIWMSEPEARFFGGDRGEASASEFFNIPVDLDFKITKKLKDGETIKLGTTNLQALVTPGHTPGGLCLYEPKSKSLFSGDTLFAQGYGRYDLLGGDLNKLRESIRKISNLGIKALYPGHGPVLKEGVGEYLKSIHL